MSPLRRVGLPAAGFTVEGNLHAEFSRLAFGAAQARAGLFERDIPAQNIGQCPRTHLTLVTALQVGDADHVGTRVIGKLVDGAGGQGHGPKFFR